MPPSPAIAGAAAPSVGQRIASAPPPDGSAGTVERLPPPAAPEPIVPSPPPVVGTPLSLDAALEWTLARNPDLIAVRRDLSVSAAAVAVARRFPTSLNPTLSVDARPWVFERTPGPGISNLPADVTITWAQPIELGHRTAQRTAIAEAAYSQTRWTVLQAELMAMVQTYRAHQASVYRREKFRVAEQLAEFNHRLLHALHGQMEANQVPAAEVLLAEVEDQSTAQRVQSARQEYVAAVSELCQQIGSPRWANAVEPVGELCIPEQLAAAQQAALVCTAFSSRPEIRAARARVAESQAALALARAERIPVPSIGPVYEKNESNASFYGIAVSTPVPLLNSGATAVRQREAEHQRDVVALEALRQKINVEVQTALTRAVAARRLLDQTYAITAPLQQQAGRMQRLYDAGQADLVKLFQVRQRLIEAENARLDAAWLTIQAYADLLTAIGATPLLAAAPAELPTPAGGGRD